MSDQPPAEDERLRILAGEFSKLGPADQDLVLTIVARLRGKPYESPSEPPFHKPDGSFMDFLDE